MKKTFNSYVLLSNANTRHFKMRALTLSLIVATLGACTGGNKTTSSSSVANSSSAAINSSAISSRSSNSIASSVSSVAPVVSSVPMSSSSRPTVVSSATQVSSVAFSSVAHKPGAPYASVSGTFPDDVALAPANILFKSDQSWDEDGVITNVQWDFGDGTSSTQINPRHTYTNPGTYNVTLTVTDNDKLTNTTLIPITVITQVGVGLEPTASIRTSKTRGQIPLAVTFDGRDSEASGNASLVSYKWDFPDKTSAYGPVVNKTFDQAYSHKVFLTVTDNQGLSSETSVEVQGILNVPKGVPGAALQTAGNPFSDSAFYVSPDIETLQNQSLAKINPNTQSKLFNDMKFVQQMPSAV